MNDITSIVKFIGIGIVALIWLYIASRMVTRGIMRTVKEFKERKKNG